MIIKQYSVADINNNCWNICLGIFFKSSIQTDGVLAMFWQ